MGLFCLKFIAFVYVVPKNLGYVLNMRDIQMAVFCCLVHNSSGCTSKENLAATLAGATLNPLSKYLAYFTIA